MLNHKDKNSDCTNAELLISYLYDETNAAEKIAFETHLEDCAACSEELKEFNFARIAVQDWRAADFDALPTPIFEIPAQIVQSEAETSRSWFENLKLIFSFKPAMALSGLIVLIALFGIAAFVLNFKNENNSLAENIKDKGVTKTAVSPTVENRNENKDAEIVSKVQSNESESVKPNVKTVERNSPAVKSTTIKAANQPSKNNPVKAIQNDTKKTSNKTIAPKTDVPQIVEADDEEDDSIRLADLFEEIGTE